MKTQLVAEPHWRSGLSGRAAERVLRKLNRPGLARALLRLAQSSGLGLPPMMAVEFAAWLEGVGAEAGDWPQLFAAAMGGLDGRDVEAVGLRVEDGLRLAPYEAARLMLLPALRWALEQVGENLLLVNQADLPRRATGEWDQWEARLRGALTDLATSSQEDHRGWRRAMAVRLVQWARRQDDARDLVDAEAPDEIAEMDVLAAQLFLTAARLNLPVPQDRALPKSMRLGAVRAPGRLQMDGVEGVRQAPPGADPAGMLPHQLAYPFEFMVESIMNEGFQAFDRPPPMPRDRRFLFAALAADLPFGPATSLLLAAWWLAGWQVETALRLHDAQMDFLWAPLRDGQLARGSVHRDARHGARPAPAEDASRQLLRFDTPGHPFLATPGRGPLRRTVTAPPAAFLDVMEGAGINLLDGDGGRLGAFVLSIRAAHSDATARDASDDGLATLAELGALGATHIEQMQVTIAADGYEIDFGGGLYFRVPDGFAARGVLAAELAGQLVHGMYGVIGNE